MLKINKERDDLLTDYAIGMLKDFYMRDHENSPQEAYARASKAWSTYKGNLDNELAQRLYDYVSRKWFMFASPVLSNAPNGVASDKGLPISCFLTYVPDTLEGLIDHSSELRWLSVLGGGVGGHWSDVRTVSDKAPGPIPFLHTVDADMIAYRQGKTRKGSYAAYMEISHPDIVEFLNMRIPTGDVQRKALNLHNAINITDDFMQAVIDNKEWDLKEPANGKVFETVSARKLWERIIEVRFRTGEPYLNFIDEANRKLPQSLKELGLKIHGSNLCNEIHLPTSADRTAVCCLYHLSIWSSTMSGRIPQLLKISSRCWTTYLSTLLRTHQMKLQELVILHREKDQLVWERWASTHYSTNTGWHGNLKRLKRSIKLFLIQSRLKQLQNLNVLH